MYGGTKTEMERLIKDASQMTDIQKELNVTVKDGDLSFGNVAQAITVIQKNLQILGTTEAEAAGTLEGSINSMKAAWQNFLSGSGGMQEVVQTVSNVVKNVVRIVGEAIPFIVQEVTNNLPQILALGKEILNQMIQGIVSNFPLVVETALGIIKTLIDEIVNNLPQIIETATNTLLSFIDGIVDNIDWVVDTAIKIIMALIDGIIQALPKLIEKAPEIIQKLVNKIIENLPKIAQAGGEIIGKLLMGILGMVPNLLYEIGNVIGTIVEFFWNLPGRIFDIGANIIKGLWNGISSMVGWLWEKLKGFASKIVGTITSALGIHSPSRVMRDMVGQFIPKGIAVGIEANTDSVDKAIDKLNDGMIDRLKANVDANIGDINYKSALNAQSSEPMVITRDENRTIYNTQNFYDKSSTPYEEQKEAKIQLRRLAYEL